LGEGLPLAAAAAAAGAAELWALVWAFFLFLAPQIAGADRELLRLELRLRALNWLTLGQKGILLAGTFAAIRYFEDPLPPLAAMSLLAALLPALAARALVEGRWSAHPRPPQGMTARRFLGGVFSEFTLWQHAAGIVLGWIQTMDVFFLNLFGLPAREIGLYGSVLKVVTSRCSSRTLWRTSSRSGWGGAAPRRRGASGSGAWRDASLCFSPGSGARRRSR
jgi:hypothetical protein